VDLKLWMAVDSVKCTLSSASNTKSAKRSSENYLLNYGVMTNVCSPGLALNAQTHSPTRPQSSPNTTTNNTSAESNSTNSFNTSAMQHLINDSSNNSLNNSTNTPNNQSLNQSNFIDNHNSPMDERPSNQQIKNDDEDSNSKNSQTLSPKHSSNNLSSPKSLKDNDRKDIEEILTEKNKKIKELEEQLAKQRDYEQIKNELNLLKEQINLRNDKPIDLLLALDKTRSLQNENCLPKQLLPNLDNINVFTSLLGEELVRDSLLRGTQKADHRSSVTPTEANNLLFGNNNSLNVNLLDANQRISPNLRRPQSADDLKPNLNSNSNQSLTNNLTHNLTSDSFGIDNDLMMIKNNPNISQINTNISNSLLASTGNGQFLSSNQSSAQSTTNTPSSSLQIPQLDPLLTVTTPEAQAALAKLTEKLRYNVDRFMNQNLNTQNISRCVRELLSVNNIGQRLFAKYVLGLSQGTVSELLSKPKPWDKLTEKGRDSYRKMHAWASDEPCIYLLKFLVPKKGKEYSSKLMSSSINNPSSLISGNVNNSNPSAIHHGLASALSNGSSTNNYNSIAAVLSGNNANSLDDPKDRLQSMLRSQSMFNQTNNQSNNAMLELMANSNNSQTHQQLVDLLFKNQSLNNNQNGNQQSNQNNLIENDCSQMSDDLESKERSMTPLNSIYKKLTNGNNNQPNDLVQEAMAKLLFQEQYSKMFAQQMEENLKQQLEQQQSANQNNNNLNNSNNNNSISNSNEIKNSDEIRQAMVIYQQEIAKLNSGVTPSIESINRLQNAANIMNQATANQERLLLRESNISRDSDSSLNEETKGKISSSNNQQSNLSNSNNQQSDSSAFPMVKNFLNNSNNGSANLIKNENDSCSSGKSTPVNNQSLNGGQPEDLSSPLQGIQRITNSLLTQQQSHPSTSPNRSSFGSSSNNLIASANKAILPPITQHQFDLYNNLNTDDIVKKVKEQLSQYSISQRLFGESVLGLSQGSVSDLLARPKPWHMLTQKGREPFIRMRMFLEDDNAVHKLVASQYKIAPDKLMRTGSYASTANGSGQLPNSLTNELNQLNSLSGLSAALTGNLSNSAAMNALASMDNSGNPALAQAISNLLLANSGNRNQLNLDSLKLLERQQAGSPSSNASNNNFQFNNSLLESTNTQRSSANSTPERRSPVLTNINNSSPNSPQSNLFSNKRSLSSSGAMSLNGLNSNDYNSQSLNSKFNSYNNQPQSVYEMAALTDTLDTQDVTTKIKESLMHNNIGQKIFGEVVLGLSQGSVSELLSKPKPWQMLSIKGREPFIRMKMWLNDPHNIEKLQSLKNERREANKRRRNADVDSIGFPMDKLISGSNSLDNGSNDLYNSANLNNFSSNNSAANLNNILLSNLNSNQFNLNANNFGPAAKKPRVLFSDEQKEALKIAFQLDSYPANSTIEFLANELQLSVRTITNFFHNYRMRRKQASSGLNNSASSPDENSSNYSFTSNGRENTNGGTFDKQTFRQLLEQRINELKLNPANITQSTIKPGSNERFSNALSNLMNPQLMEQLIRNGGDLVSITNLMNSLANNSCPSPSSSNQEDYSYQDDCMDDDDQNDSNNVFQTTLDLSVPNGSSNALKQQTKQNYQQLLQKRNHSEDEYNLTENDEDDEIQTNDQSDDDSIQEKRSKLMLNTSSKRKGRPQWVNPANLDENEAVDKKLVDQENRLRSDEESSRHSIEAQ